MYVALTVRKLKPGSYDDWRKAWAPPEGSWPLGSRKALILRNVNHPNEVIAFGFFDGDPTSMAGDKRLAKLQQSRLEAMKPYIKEIGADGIYEVVEEITPS